MKCLDPGHEYLLDSLDGEQENRLVFVKREGETSAENLGLRDANHETIL